MAHREPRSISRAVARPETPVDARPDARVEPHREPRPLALVIVHRSVGAGDNGGLVFHCHAGCSQVAVLSALEWHEVEVTSTQGPSSEIGATGNIALLVERRGFKIAAQYGYEDEKGELLYQNVRLERYRNEKRQKTFRQRRPGPDGKGWIEKAPISSVTARGVDKLYEALQKSVRVARRLRQANVCMARMARAWDAVQRLYPGVVPTHNPFRGVELEHGEGTTSPASRAEAYALHSALLQAGEIHLAAVALIAFEWHQRPENVLAGHLSWTDYRPPERPNSVRIRHHKTGQLVWLPLVDRQGSLFPELTSYLDTLERLGVSMVLMKPKRGGSTAKPFLLRTARNRVRAAARKAALPDRLTLAACRHGGLTELGDAELTEQGVMALSGHRTPEAARLYVKRTETQRASAARKRRAWVEASRQEQDEAKSQNSAPAAESENAAK